MAKFYIKMATTVNCKADDRVPLLPAEVKELEEEEEDDRLAEDLLELQREFEREYPLRTPPRDNKVAAPKAGPAGFPGLGADRVRRKHFSGNEMIVAVFVVVFDTKRGVCVCVHTCVHNRQPPPRPLQAIWWNGNILQWSVWREWSSRH